MGCGQSKEVLTNQKSASELLTNQKLASELLTNQGVLEAVAKMIEDDDMKTANKIETVEEEKETDKENSVCDDKGVEEISKEEPVVTVEPLHLQPKGAADIKGADVEDAVKDSTNQSAASDILTNQKPEEPMDNNDDPPPPYQTLSGIYYFDLYKIIFNIFGSVTISRSHFIHVTVRHDVLSRSLNLHLFLMSL